MTPAGGTLTQTTFQTFLRAGFRYGSSEKLLLASPLVLSAIEGFARNNYQVNDNPASTYGVKMNRYVSGQGDILIAKESWLNDSTNYRGWAFLVDLDNVFWAPLRDTKYLEERQAPDLDKIEDEFLTEACFIYQLENTHAILKGVTG